MNLNCRSDAAEHNDNMNANPGVKRQETIASYLVTSFKEIITRLWPHDGPNSKQSTIWV